MKRQMTKRAAALFIAAAMVFTFFGCGNTADDTDTALRCTLSINCGEILDNMDKLAPEKAGIVPNDGVIYPETEVEFSEGESVLDVLLRETRANKIHMEYEDTPAYNSVYIEGIANIYGGDCGAMSGWTYRVNGVSPSLSCNKYALKDGDRIEFIFICDFSDTGAEAE